MVSVKAECFPSFSTANKSPQRLFQMMAGANGRPRAALLQNSKWEKPEGHTKDCHGSSCPALQSSDSRHNTWLPRCGGPGSNFQGGGGWWIMLLDSSSKPRSQILKTILYFNSSSVIWLQIFWLPTFSLSRLRRAQDLTPEPLVQAQRHIKSHPDDGSGRQSTTFDPILPSSTSCLGDIVTNSFLSNWLDRLQAMTWPYHPQHRDYVNGEFSGERAKHCILPLSRFLPAIVIQHISRDSSLSQKDQFLPLKNLSKKKKRIYGDDYDFPGSSEYVKSINKPTFLIPLF